MVTSPPASRRARPKSINRGRKLLVAAPRPDDDRVVCGPDDCEEPGAERESAEDGADSFLAGNCDEPADSSLSRRPALRICSITLPGFTSRWTTPCSCAYCKASATT